MLEFSFMEVTPYEINRGIASRLRAVRKRRKISQARLSEKAVAKKIGINAKRAKEIAVQVQTCAQEKLGKILLAQQV